MQKNFLAALARMTLVPVPAALSVPAAAQPPTPTPLAVAAGPLGAVQVSGLVSGAALFASPQFAGGSGGLSLTNGFVSLWTPTEGKWTIEPYLVLFRSATSPVLGYSRAANALGAAVLAAYRCSALWSLAARSEFATGGAAGSTAAHQNILGFGPAARLFTFTVTPTWNDDDLFDRADCSWVALVRFTPGLGFGAQGRDAGQLEIALEGGVAF